MGASLSHIDRQRSGRRLSPDCSERRKSWGGRRTKKNTRRKWAILGSVSYHLDISNGFYPVRSRRATLKNVAATRVTAPKTAKWIAESWVTKEDALESD